MSKKPSTQQLTLLPAPDVPLQFRLDEATRRRGLRHLAEIRRQMAARQADRAAQRSDVSRPNAA
jgi:hypothetical protein